MIFEADICPYAIFNEGGSCFNFTKIAKISQSFAIFISVNSFAMFLHLLLIQKTIVKQLDYNPKISRRGNRPPKLGNRHETSKILGIVEESR